MHWEFIVALIIAIPVILFPAAVVWYFNIGGVYTAIKKAYARRALKRSSAGETDNADTEDQRIKVPEDEDDEKY